MRRWWWMIALAACSTRDDARGVTCDERSPVLGVAGGYADDVFALPWSADGATTLSVGPTIAVVVPDDVTALAITADAGRIRTGFTRVTLDGRVLVDAFGGARFGSAARAGDAPRVDSAAWDSGDTGGTVGTPGWYADPLFHAPAVAGTIKLPMNADTRPWGGCLVIEAAALERPGDDGALHVVTKRSPPTADRLDLDLVVVEGAGIGEDDLAAAVDVMAGVYEGGDALTIGRVETWSLPLAGGPYVGGSAGLADLRASRLPGSDPWAMRLFFVADFAGAAGTLGLAAGIPGPIGVPDTGGSGVVLSVESHQTDRGAIDTRTLGETMAHEAGHQLGLFHTTEWDGGSFDVVGDTPECTRARDADRDGELSAEECASLDGANFMFWVAGNLRQDDVTPEQADVLRRSPAAVEESP